MSVKREGHPDAKSGWPSSHRGVARGGSAFEWGYVLGRRALRALHDVELHFLPFRERAESAVRLLNGRMVDEDVLLAVVAGEEAEADPETDQGCRVVSGASGSAGLDHGIPPVAGGILRCDGIGRSFVRIPRAYNDLPFADSPYQDNMSYGYTVVVCESFKTLGKHISFFKAYDKNSADLSFTCHHGVASVLVLKENQALISLVTLFSGF